MAALALIEAKMGNEKCGAVGLAALCKAQNDTIKAIRQHRVLTKTADVGDEQTELLADQVKARLRRLSEVGRPVVAIQARTEDEEPKTGT